MGDPCITLAYVRQEQSNKLVALGVECRKAQSNFTMYLFSVMLSQRGNMHDDQNIAVEHGRPMWDLIPMVPQGKYYECLAKLNGIEM